VLTVAAALSTRSPFVAPLDKRDAADEAKRQFAGSGSDLLAVQAAYTGWLQARREGGKCAPHTATSRRYARVCVAGANDTTAQLPTDIGTGDTDAGS
jgi:hypothetical protein